MALVLGLSGRSSVLAGDDAGTPPAVLTLTARVVENAPAIDGVLRPDEWPETPAATATLDHGEQNLPERRERWKGPADASAVVRVAADAEALYLGISVVDDVGFHTGEPWWGGDSIELFLHTPSDGSPPGDAYTQDDRQVFLMPGNPNLHWGVAFQGQEARFDDGGLVGVRVASVPKQGGSYDLEARIPLANFPGLAGGEAKRLGFALALNDVDGLAPAAGGAAGTVPDPATYLSWNRGFELWRRPKHFGWLEIPARTPRAVAAPAPEVSGSTELWVAAIAGLLLVIAFVGPGSRRLAASGPRWKAAMLVLDALLAGFLATSASCADRRARGEARERLAAAAREANVVAIEAAEAGALDPGDPAARARTLLRLLEGASVPAIPPVAAQAYVPLGLAWTDADVRAPLAYRIPLGADAEEDWPLAAPTPARALRLRLEPAPDASGGRRPSGERVRLGVLVATRADGTTEDLPVEANLSEGPGERAVRLPLSEATTLSRLRWRGTQGAPAVVLRSITALREDGVETTVLLPSTTLDGVPVLARPGTRAGAPDFVGFALAPGASREVALPPLPGADRLWLVVAAERAFPSTRHGVPVARVRIAYASGEPTEVTLKNGEDVDDERLNNAIKHPADMRSRVAYRWVDESGIPHHHDVLAVPLAFGRAPASMTVENLGAPVSEQGTGEFTLVAATLTRRATDPVGGRLLLDAGGGGGRDTVRLADPKPFRDVLAGPARETVSVSAAVGRDDRKATLTLSTQLPAEIRARASRTETALLTCLVLAAFLLVLLAVDAFQAIPRLRPRLVLGVLVAALLPVAVTIVLADRRNAARLEADREGRVRGWLALARAALVDGERQEAQVGAQGLLQVVASLREAGDATRVREAVTVYRRTGIVGGAAAAVVVKGRDLGTLAIEPEAHGARIDGAAFLADATDAPGLYASPWDGLLLVATARTVGREDWRKVVLGIRVDDDFVSGRLATALADPEAEIAVLSRTGEPAGVAGPGGTALARGLAAAFPALREGGGGLDAVLLSKLRTAEGPRLALLTPLESAASPGVPAAWLAVAVPRRALDAEVLRLREELGGLGIAAALLVACVAAMLARRIAGPVRALVDATDGVRRGDFDAPVPSPSRDEVGDLAAAFDRMRLGLKHRVGDLDFLRRSQETASASLDLPGTAEAGLRCFRERWPADAGLLLVALSPTGPVQVRGTWGRGDVSDAPIAPAPGGWMAATLASAEPIVVADAAADPRALAETAALRRLLQGRNAWICVPLRAGGEAQGLVVLAWEGAAALPTAEERALLTPLAGIVALAVHNARLYRLAALDESTGLPGATAFESALRRDVDAALEGGPAAVVLRIGLDGFERVARQRGLEPARALRRAQADALRAAALGRAQAGRLAEDEFAVRVPGATRDEAARLAASIRERLSAVEVRPEDGGDVVRGGVSIGVARCPEDAKSFEFLLDGAARAMRAARRDGGDRVEDVAHVDAGLVLAPPFEDGAVFRTERMVHVLETARRAARTDSTVLLTGETGVGKEVIADLLHRRSRRAERPFVKVNTAAFPEALLESELFGHEKGAFTGADRRREGRFELADGGTLFLDEVGEMSREAQVRLLRVLADGTFTRLGGQKPLRADVRVVAATNRDLEKAVAAGQFREDLYYRLNVLRIEIPPLRDRREEIPALVAHFLAEAKRRIGRGPSRLSPQAMDVLYRHSWPGNLRELKNVIERAAVLCEADVAGPEHLRLDPPRSSGAPGAPGVAAPLDGLNERQRALLAYLGEHGRCTNRRYIEMNTASARTGLRDLQDLMSRGLIVREGKRRGAVYRLP